MWYIRVSQSKLLITRYIVGGKSIPIVSKIFVLYNYSGVKHFLLYNKKNVKWGKLNVLIFILCGQTKLLRDRNNPKIKHYATFANVQLENETFLYSVICRC